ncbi:hypothetical protein ACFQ1E_07115 [Sphingomonas canadensis]|uniref:Transmembrane protein (PGPGW) n=1 Tax=Sphingomonas canadensis TaxID=1219257 RepID=A0ABW3H444_9SPHN|nr:hypothetical protein [Sphingomonas canadensis]MCW3835446.1 hypothetical protein [Sphingomonas canadensis]
MPAHAPRRRNPLVRSILFATGVLVIIASPIVGAIPGPGGIFVFAAGLVLVLQNSAWARKRFARWKRRYPKFGNLADTALRRRSARRRYKREQDAILDAGLPPADPDWSIPSDWPRLARHALRRLLGRTPPAGPRDSTR